MCAVFDILFCSGPGRDNGLHVGMLPNATRTFARITLLAFLIFWLLFYTSPAAAVQDPPHDDTNSIGCTSCHDMAAYDQPNLIPDPAVTPLTIDETRNNLLCWSCHYDGGPATGAMTHSSVQTDTGYGEWTVECVGCHNQHTQEQDRANGTAYGKYIQTRINLSDIHYADATPPKTGYKTVTFIGPTGPNSFADGDATIDGICEVCHTRTNHWRNDGSLAGIGAHIGLEGSNCMTCHPHSQGFKVQCNDCHDFPPGQLVFNPAPTGSATAGAHTTHIDKNYPCQTCHKDSVGNGPTHNSGDGAITMGFSLFNGSYEGGSYDGQATASYNATATAPLATTVSATGTKTCSNIFCHGRRPDGTLWGGGVNTTPAWDGTVSCGDCHRATNASPPSSGQHAEHAGLHNGGYEYPCSFCHQDPAVDGSLHGNNRSEVIFSSNPMTQGGVYNGDTDMLGSYGTCDNIYCHSTVQSSPPGSGPTYRTTPAWNGSMGGCDKCHYTWGSVPGLTTGSHDPHFFQYETQQCYACHNWQNSDDACFSCHDAGINPDRSKHANYAVNVAFMPSYGGSYSGTPTPGDAYGRCDNTYCHSNGTSVATGSIPANSSPDWGTPGPLACDSCHGDPPDYPNYDPATPKANSHERHSQISDLTCATCHYNTTTDGTTITNAANHVNMQYDVVPSPTFRANNSDHANTFDYTFDSGGGTCSNISCHIYWTYSDTKRWGGQAGMNVGFSYSSYQVGCYGVNVNAVTPSCSPPELCQPPYTYTWDFGDGTVIEGSASESHDYGVLGDFDVTLTMQSATGIKGTNGARISTSAPANIQPTIDKTVAVVGMTATITDLSVDPDYNFCDHSGPAQVRIDWDDGTVEILALNLTDVPSGQTFSHTYVTGGSKVIKYYIWDNADTWWLTSPNVTITVPQ